MQQVGEFRRAATAVLVVCVGFLAWSFTPAADGFAGVVVSDLACLGAAVALAAVALRESFRSAGRRRVHLLVLGLAGAAWAAGEALWSVYEVLLGRDAPFPSWADVGYLAFVPLAALATMLLPDMPGDGRARLRATLDGLLIGGALLFLSWSTLLGRAYEQGGETALGAAIAVAYPVADVVLATIALSVLTRVRAAARVQALCVAGGLLGFVVADSAFAVLSLHGTYRSGIATDLGWVAGGLLMALSVRAPSYGESADSDAPVARGLTALPYVPLAVAALTALWSGVMHDGLGPIETTIGAMVVGLVIARQLLGVSDNARLTASLAATIAEAQEREEHFRALVQGSSDVLTICERDGVIRFISPAVYRMFGYHPDELLGTELIALVHPDDAERVRAETVAAINDPGPPVTIECRYRRADGAWLHIEALLSNDLDDPHIGGLVFNTRDVSERRELERQLTHQAFHDPLTGLANRALFRDRVEHALAVRGRSDNRLAVLFLDLDGFKAINDSLGHSVGDRLLAAVSRRLNTCVRPGDTVARLGGDEFAVLLEDIDGIYVAEQVSSRFIADLQTPFALDRHEVFVGASIGVALSGEVHDADELLRNADLAMYRAKALGKNRCEVFEPDMHAAALDRMAIESDLRHAIVRDELVLHYQPLVELASGRIVGVEALLRWNHSTRGLVSPLEFIGVAEESGLVVPLGRWVLTEACRQVARWRRETGLPLRLSVNISARQLQAPRLAEHVARTLRSTGIAPSDLVLEITESMLVDDAERTIAKLHLLRELGVRLAIDDFGTGYSSLNYLRRLPVDVLKIDRSFVKGIGTEAELTSLTSAIVGIGRDLGLETVAEGIEEPAQLDALRAMGCGYGQGYLYSPALPVDDMAPLLASGSALGLPAVVTA
ncbi:MAG TPA: EAL domain-containing protein [Frankiaceae bacterium]|nr:EAL domain-containing protein [Frankiaceae bacterium]